jgi:hypothetical protein
VPTPATAAHTTRGRLGQECCTDAPEQDGSRCPRGEALTCRCDPTALGRPLRSDATGACRRCPLHEPGPSNTDGRRMTRWSDAHVRERLAARRNAHPTIMPERKPRVAHPCGTSTPAHDPGSCRMRGLTNVRAACRRSGVADTLTRGLNILGVPQRLAALGEGGPLRDVGPRESTGRRHCRGADQACSHDHSRPHRPPAQVSMSVHTVWPTR